MRRRGVIVFVAGGALALALGGVLLRVGTEHSPGSAAASGSAGVSGSAASGQGGGGETAASGAERAIDP